MSFSPTLQFPVDDTISYKVYVAKAVPVADVTVTAQLELMVSNRDENPDLDSRIRGALKDFLPATNGHSRNRPMADTGAVRIISY